MEVLAQLGGMGYAVVAIVVGLRLIRLSLRTRRFPELLIGAGLLCLAGLAYPLSAVVRDAAGMAHGAREALGATAALLAVGGIAMMTAFTWMLFRRDQLWGKALFAAVTAYALGLFVVQAFRGDWAAGELFWDWQPLSVSASFGWAAVECGRYYGAMRRRLRLGLADPVVVNRFLLYAWATALGVLTNSVGWVFRGLDLEMLTHPLGAPLLFVLGSSSSALMLLAFLPPAPYLAWLRARNERAAVA